MSATHYDFQNGTGNFASGLGNFNAAYVSTTRLTVKLTTGQRIKVRLQS